MKQLRNLTLLLVIVAMLVTLCSCGKNKVEPEKINTKDYSRTIQVEDPKGSVEIVHSDKSVASADAGTELRSDDTVKVGADSELSLLLDGNKHLLAEENTTFRMQASGKPESGKTRICLDNGAVVCGIDQALAAGELFEVQTSDCTISSVNGIFRVEKITGADGTEYTLVEVFEGEANVVINATGATAAVKAGEAVMVEAAKGKKPEFVLADEIDADFWKSAETTGMTVGKDGTGKTTLPIPYSKLPASALEELAEYADSGRTLSVSAETVQNLLTTGHDYAETVVKEASCSEEGLATLVCNLCGESGEKVLPMAEHTPEVIEAVEADCVTDGLTEGSKCSVCGEILKEQEVVPALGHTEEILEAVAADCVTDGLTEGIKCSVCGEILKEQEVAPALGHTEEVVAAGTVDCVTDGLTAGIKCSVCAETLEEQKAVSALGHMEEVMAAVAADCVTDGLTEGIKCSACGEILKAQRVVPALGHTEEILAAVAADCLNDGLTEGVKCSVCGKVLVEQKKVPALGHKEEKVAAVEATCIQTGLTEGARCTVCGEWLVEQKEIPVEAHTAVKLSAVEPVCASNGLTEGSICEVCGEILVPQEEIPALGHVPQKLRGKPTACYRDGWTEGSRCTVCGEILIPCEVIPAIPHVTGSLSRVEPTCSSIGWTYGEACYICGEILKEQVAIPKLPHTLGTEHRELNTLEPGVSKWCHIAHNRCTVCNQEVDEVRYHKAGTPVSTTLSDGSIETVTSCQYCGMHLSVTTTPAPESGEE